MTIYINGIADLKLINLLKHIISGLIEVMCLNPENPMRIW